MTRLIVVAALAFAGLLSPAIAEETAEHSIIIKDHKFDPEELKVPAGKVIVLTVDNQDATPEEFESPLLKVEKVIPGNTKGKVRFGPLVADTYLFYGEFNMETARGVVTAE